MGHERTDRSLEHEANRFAAAFLMPRDVVRAAVAGPASLDDLLELKARLGVSAQAMAYALHDADRLSDWSLRQVLAELDRRGYLTAEPGSTLRHESSRVFAALASHLRGQHMSGTRWAGRIGQRASDVGAFTLGQVLVAA